MYGVQDWEDTQVFACLLAPTSRNGRQSQYLVCSFPIHQHSCSLSVRRDVVHSEQVKGFFGLLFISWTGPVPTIKVEIYLKCPSSLRCCLCVGAWGRRNFELVHCFGNRMFLDCARACRYSFVPFPKQGEMSVGI